MKLRYKHELSQKYWAGYLTATLHNTFYSRTDLPSPILCLKNSSLLPTLFGKYYSLLASNKKTSHIVKIYDQFNQMGLPKELDGQFTDFFLGFSQAIKKHKLDKSDLKHFGILDILVKSSN